MADKQQIGVRPYQVLAARLAVDIAKKRGRTPDPLMQRIAAAHRGEAGEGRVPA